MGEHCHDVDGRNSLSCRSRVADHQPTDQSDRNNKASEQMQRTPPLRTLLVAGLAAIMPGPGHANDSSSALAAGGLVLTKTNAISMQREDLFVSPVQIRVRSEMRNDRNIPVTLHVAFPLPELPVDTPAGLDIRDANGETLAHNIELPLLQRPNFIAFYVSANGRGLTPGLEIRAALPDGRNIAEQLREVGGWSLVLNPRMFRDEPTPDADALSDIGPAALRKLRDLGAVTGADNVFWPIWKTYITFHWQQTFPPGVTVIEHRYQPVIGQFRFKRDNGKWTGGAVGDSTDANQTYCIQETTDRAMQHLASHDAYGYLSARSLAYILNTGANWAGPIETFHLTIDGANLGASNQTALISLCSEIPLKFTAPLRLEGTTRNYVPKHDLKLLMVPDPTQKLTP